MLKYDEYGIKYVSILNGYTGSTIDRPAHLRRKIVQILVQQDRKLQGHELSYLRQASRLTVDELCSLLGVRQWIVEGWEEGTIYTTSSEEFTLRMIAAETIRYPITARETFRRIGGTQGPRPLVLEMRNGCWKKKQEMVD